LDRRGGEDVTNYYLVYPKQHQEDAVFSAFRDWLLQQCDATPDTEQSHHARAVSSFRPASR
jgi:hypothetical protein